MTRITSEIQDATTLEDEHQQGFEGEILTKHEEKSTMKLLLLSVL